MSRLPVVVVGVCLAGAPTWAEPIRGYHLTSVDPATVPAVVDSHILFLNRCTGGCIVTEGTTDSRTDTSDIGHGELSAYPYGDSSWSQVLSCVKAIMAPFNITVTDQDPGTMDHFEVMVAGMPQQIGLSSNYGGIADVPCNGPGSCSQYLPDALVFDFTQVWGGSVTQDCATIAQEAAHAWALDHVTLDNDPMTYNPLQPPLSYHDGAPCGSDCSGGKSPFGLTCNGQTHACLSNNLPTQNEVTVITALFGPAGAAPPSLSITSPDDGTAQQAGFAVDVTCTSSDGVAEVDLQVDDAVVGGLQTPPFNFTAPTTLKDGAHTVTAICTSKLIATATKTIDVIIGTKCSKDSDCPTNDICYEQACIAGPQAQGGLGTACKGTGDCASGACASDGSEMLCVVPCDPSDDRCPSGFGC
ncbi:MAG TPA: Ig-like domain-containing protein, partial [Kofleriaceae bacterium]|nr:Ig-like domain-containing protein [Kofleriaceae bacterium]